MNPDAYIFESTGYINSSKEGYGTPIAKRLSEQGYTSKIVSLTSDFHTLEEIPRGIPLIIAGGDTLVTDNSLWLNRTKHYLRGVMKNNGVTTGDCTPVLGIAFGAELISEILRPGIVETPNYLSIGQTKLTKTKDSILLEGYKTNFQVYTCQHNKIKYDESIISGITLQEDSYVNAFEVKHILSYGVQFHPEFTQQEYISLLSYQLDKTPEKFNIDIEGIVTSKDINNSLILSNFMKLSKG